MMKIISTYWFILLTIFNCCVLTTSYPNFSSNLGKNEKTDRKEENKPLEPVSDQEAFDYLQKFGYFAPSSIHSSELKSDNTDFNSEIATAIRKFQLFAGLTVTGKFDRETKLKMAQPRCGMNDAQALEENMPFSPVNELTARWNKKQLTYAIRSYTTDLPQSHVRHAIREAFNLWSAVVPLDFKEVSPLDLSADIKIEFGTQYHNDSWPFDGKGGVLAHALYPTSGVLHFDDDENWAYMDPVKISSDVSIDFFYVAIHEIGHTLGVRHLKDENSIMVPFMQTKFDENGNYVIPTLQPADIQAIQEIYGSRIVRRTSGNAINGSNNSNSNFESNNRTGGSKSRSENRRDNRRGDGGVKRYIPECPEMIDAYTEGFGGAHYMFAGTKVYKIYEIRNRTIIKVRSLRLLFPNGPIYVEAAYVNKKWQTISLFYNYLIYVYKYKNGKFVLVYGYPLRMPNVNPTGAIRWTNGDRVLFLPYNRFAIYFVQSNSISRFYQVQKTLSGFPTNVKGGFREFGQILKLFTQTHVYRYNAYHRIMIGEPQTIKSYLGC